MTGAAELPPDEHWQPLAIRTRAALAHLGYPIGPRCLPGEAEPCGGNCAEHATAYLACLIAVINHHLAHLTTGYGPGWVGMIGEAAYTDTSTKLAQECGNIALAELGEEICDMISRMHP